MNAREELKKIPTLCRVLVEYEKTRSNKTAREMWEILLNDILAKLPELGFVRLEDVEIDKDKIRRLYDKWKNDFNDFRPLITVIAEAKGILRVKEGK